MTNTYCTWSIESRMILKLMTKTEGGRDDVLYTLLQTDLIVFAPERLDIDHFSSRTVELLDCAETGQFGLPNKPAAYCAPLLLSFEIGCVLLLRKEDVRRGRKGDGLREMRVKELIEKSARVVVWNLHVVLTVSNQYRDVDVLNYRHSVELLTQ